jgi:tetratricopeptide (TPR) repeat protein
MIVKRDRRSPYGVRLQPMKSIHRLLSRFGIVSAIALVLLSSAYAATLERQASGTTFLPPGAVVAFTVPIPQPLAPEPALVRVGTPVQDCRDFSNLDRTIEACTRVNASKNLAKRTRAIALSNRCSAYQLKGMLDKAILDCDRAVGLDRANPEAFYNRGRAARKKGDLARAIADYSSAVRLTPRSSKSFAKTYNNRGDAYAEAGDNDRATADFDEAINLDPSYAKAYHNRGVIHSRRGDLDRAVADYSKALELDPTLSRALVARGNAHFRRRDMERAVADYQAALRIDPADTIARRGLERASANAPPGAAVELAHENLQVE